MILKNNNVSNVIAKVPDSNVFWALSSSLLFSWLFSPISSLSPLFSLTEFWSTSWVTCSGSEKLVKVLLCYTFWSIRWYRWFTIIYVIHCCSLFTFGWAINKSFFYEFSCIFTIYRDLLRYVQIYYFSCIKLDYPLSNFFSSLSNQLFPSFITICIIFSPSNNNCYCLICIRYP